MLISQASKQTEKKIFATNRRRYIKMLGQLSIAIVVSILQNEAGMRKST